MKKHYLFMGIMITAVVVVLSVQGHSRANNCSSGVCGLFPKVAVANAAEANSDLPTGTEQLTFVELGSVNCIPCKQMQPVMKAIEEEYAGKVKVVFHDVWTDEGEAYGRQYGIRLIPTQVFIDKDGNEVFRHEGFFPQAELEAMLAEQGITK